MSQWSGLSAEFHLRPEETEESGQKILNHICHGSPTGSEIARDSPDGFDCYEYEGRRSIWLDERRLRDYGDPDTPGALAWFAKACLTWDPEITSASMTIDVDSGPRYRFEWTREKGLIKLRGVLDW